MINAIDVIDKLPFELQAALLADEFFLDIPVVIYEKGNVLQEVAKAQAVLTAKDGKHWGVAVIILQCTADDDLPEVSFGSMLLKPAFQVIELVAQNESATGVKKSARKVSRKIRDVIKPLQLPGLCTQFVFAENCILPVPIANQNLVSYQVECSTYEADDQNIEQVSMPVITLDDPNDRVILSCATPGAQIWYTLDDSFPVSPKSSPGSGAIQYKDPVPIPAKGFTMRAAAVKFGDPNGLDLTTYIPSSPQRAIINHP